jgi:hypothetical protein
VDLRWLAPFLASSIACGGRTGLEASVDLTPDGGGASDGAGGPDGLAGPSGAVLFGGDYHLSPTSVAYLGDTWTWDGSGWTQRNVSAPSPRSAASAATLAGNTVLFGGGDGQTIFGETWSWDGTGWTRLDVSGPPARAAAAMATLGDSVVLFGGGGASVSELGDTWTWDGQSWTQHAVTGPSPRVAAVAATLPGQVVLYGGYTNGGLGFPDDTWTWDGSRWTRVNVAGPGEKLGAPSLFLDCSAATLGSAMVLLCAGQTWLWDGASWQEQQVVGPSLEGAAVTTGSPSLLLFGGWDGTNDSASTWTWGGSGDWMKVQAGGPQARSFAAIAGR